MNPGDTCPLWLQHNPESYILPACRLGVGNGRSPGPSEEAVGARSRMHARLCSQDPCLPHRPGSLLLQGPFTCHGLQDLNLKGIIRPLRELGDPCEPVALDFSLPGLSPDAIAPHMWLNLFCVSGREKQLQALRPTLFRGWGCRQTAGAGLGWLLESQTEEAREDSGAWRKALPVGPLSPGLLLSGVQGSPFPSKPLFSKCRVGVGVGAQ